eukprot:CAMPEP_0206428588 /NCGR_PEP_ID=MMETSP0324_2-20121206/5759_1 /ASSEMBLY_ACC=CAM_ASM_000836 /TAXON_ID=2866 /ORGANISM="Crypthecodinium cohnii, Strain Seligo" /LENGTH=339 /DNA_ID=CAMNT_0053894155 /DNA_START=46 /DNA_END=1065 /DNA_ORIENTATION=+
MKVDCLLFSLCTAALVWPGIQEAVEPSSFPETRSLGLEKRFLCDKNGSALPILLSGVGTSAYATLKKDVAETLRPAPRELKEEKRFSLYPKFLDKTYNKSWGLCSDPHPGLVAAFMPGLIHQTKNARKLVDIYGPMSQELVFLLGLREPFRRLFSDYMVRRHKDFKEFTNFEDLVASFMMAVFRNEAKLEENTTSKEAQLVEAGLYHYQIRSYLSAGFLPSQFIIYPNDLYFQHRGDLAANPVLQAVRKKLGPDLLRPTENRAVSPPVETAGDEKTLEEGCAHGELRQLIRDKVFSPANKKLMELLAEQVGKGMVLVGYEGKANDVAAVTEWLTSSWGG